MFHLSMPRIKLLDRTLQSKDFHHSILISVLRGLAALQVAAAHLRAQLFPGLKGMDDPTLWYQALAFITGFAHQAVVIFFLLSGWLVGGSLLDKLREPRIMANYAIDRITRLWIVLIPAFLLTLAVGAFTQAVDPSVLSFAPGNEYSVTAFIGNLFGLQDMAVPRFGGNFALWSLANETWYYVLFPLLVLPVCGKTLLGRVAPLLAAVLVACYLSADIMLYLPVWLLGVAFSRIRIDASAAQRWAMLAIFAALSVYFRLTGSNDTLVAASLVQDVVFSTAFLLLLSSLQFKADFARRWVRVASAAGARLAAFSFTLYVVHVPLLVLLKHATMGLSDRPLSPHHVGDLGLYLLMLVLIVVAAFLFYLPFEAQTGRARAALKRLLFGPRVAAGYA
jgi:peptidoglycan/LPS O-acetylase OafA/YrhL